MIEIRPIKTKEDAGLIEIMENERGGDKLLTRDGIYNEIKYDGCEYYAAVSDGDLCGYCAIGVQEFDNSILIRKIYVKKKFEKGNVEKTLIKFFIEEHSKKNFKLVWIHMNKNDECKIEKYKSLGFLCVEDNFETGEQKMAYKIQEVF